MKNKRINNTVHIVLLFISISSFAQGPWTKEKGKFYTQLSFTTIPSYTTLFGSPDYEITGEISDKTLQIYGEYGVTNSTTLIVNIPYKLVHHSGLVNPYLIAPCPENSNKEASIGKIEIGLKHNFYKKN